MRLRWHGPCYGSTGYAYSGRGIIMALSDRRVKIELCPTDLKKKSKKLFKGWRKLKLLEKPLEKKPKINVYHNIPNRYPSTEGISIGLTYWETTRIPKDWTAHCNRMDHIIVFSEMNRLAFLESGVKVPINVLPSGVNVEPQCKEIDPSLIPQDILPKGFIHLPNKNVKRRFSFFSVSQWLPRKGFDILLQAYLEEFQHNEEVLLVIKTKKSPAISDKRIYQEVRKLFSSNSAPPIIVYCGDLDNKKMDMLFQMSQAYVLPSRGEGVGLPYLEAGRVGLPVIATGWGGQRDFLNESNSYLIDYSMVPAQQSKCSPYYSSDQLWANPNKDHLRVLLRKVYENREEAKLKGLRLKEYILKNHSWDRTAKMFKHVVKTKFSLK